MKKFVWLNLNTGEFSNSWNENEYPQDSHVWVTLNKTIDEIKEDDGNGWKLIEYSCANDERFEFYNKMKIVTNLIHN